MRMKRERVPGLLLGMVEGGASLLERRVLLLLEGCVPWARRWRWVCAGACVVVMGVACLGVGMLAVRASVAQGTQLAFDAVSIHMSNKDGSQTIRGPQKNGPTADGYQMRNLFFTFPILTAYVPNAGNGAMYIDSQIEGLPKWADDDPYNIDAKVAQADLKDWQNPSLQPAMLRAMLQSMLEDRLKMVVHREVKQRPIYSLVLGKGGPKLKKTDPNEQHKGLVLPGGATISSEMHDGVIDTHFYGITMGMLGTMWAGSAARPIQDKTGLAGKYDVTIEKPVPACSPHCGAQQADGPGSNEPSIFSIADELGLKLVPATGPVEILVD
jgi:uncharacterized protein (TIGR03435 family)